MNVKCLIEILQRFDEELPVCVADANDAHIAPIELEESEVNEVTESCKLEPDFKPRTTTFIKLGID